MSNPMPAYKNSRCDECENEIPTGEDVYFHDGNKFCMSCAEEADIICECGNYKNPDYTQCYSCARS